jgi:hypothetical protein
MTLIEETDQTDPTRFNRPPTGTSGRGSVHLVPDHPGPRATRASKQPDLVTSHLYQT